MSDKTFAEFLTDQAAFSFATFGSPAERGPLGPIDHAAKEIEEIRENPHDLEEYADLVILAMDAALRAGATPHGFAHIVEAKQAKNRSRVWPNWQDLPPDSAVEHVRGVND